MIAPIAGLSVKGAIFHQGYNNAFEGSIGAEMYRNIFPKMIRARRETFNDPAMPFGIPPALRRRLPADPRRLLREDV